MRSLFIVFLLTLPLSAWPSFFKKSVPAYDLQSGDIVFQATGGRQCQAIRAATHSPYSHCGVVFRRDGRLFVLEAISPVTVTPLEVFRKRSISGSFHARRLKNAGQILTQASFDRADRWARNQLGKPYDIHFLWSNERLYCSELVWKLFKSGNDIELCKPRRYDTFDLSSPLVQQLILQRFGSRDKFPAAELVVAPHDLATSPHLVEVPFVTERVRVSK